MPERRKKPEPETGSRPTSARPLVPNPRAPIPTAIVKTQGAFPLIYRKRVADVTGKAQPGDWVLVQSEEGRVLGYGLWNPRSEVAVRLLKHGDALPDDAFIDARIDRAIALRRDVLQLDDVTDSYRVIHAESDGFSGLVVDRLGDVLSAECFSLGWFQRAPELLARIGAKLGTKHTLVRASPQFLSQEGYEPQPIASEGLPPQVTIEEHGVRYRVRFEGSHKTGFFCDQRDNRRQIANWSAGKSVLDLCCYTGGFAVSAKTLGKAAEVTAVDLDEEPLAVAKDNANLNQVRIHCVQADAFTYMRDRILHGVRYDVVVLDPPKLIRTRQEIEDGTKKHFDLNRLAMRLVKPGGLLLSCSCAGLLPEAEFMKLLLSAARQAGAERPPDAEGRVLRDARRMQILARTGASADHPVASDFPESEYLKAVFMRLE